MFESWRSGGCLKAGDPRWTVVAVCDLRIGGIKIASTTENNVGISSSFKEALAPG